LPASDLLANNFNLFLQFYDKRAILGCLIYFFSEFLTMAKLFLDSTDDAVVSITNNNYTIFGFAGKTVSVAAGVTGITLKNTVEAVKLSGNLSDYTFLQTGTTVEVRKVGSTTVVTTVSPQADDNGTQFDFGNNGVFNVKNVAGVAGALPTITFGGATISSSAAAAVSGATANTGTVVSNALPVVTVPSTAASAIIGQSNAISGVTFTDADDNTGFTVTVKASGTSQVSFSSVSTAIVKDSTGGLLGANQGSNTVTLAGTKAVLTSVLGNLQYISNASVAGAETATVTVTDAKGGSATSTVNVAVAKQIALATSTATASLSGTVNDDQFTGTLSNFNNYSTPNSVLGAGGNDKLILTAVTGALTGLASGISTLDLTTSQLTGTNETASVDASKFDSSLKTINFTANSTTVVGGAGDANDSLTMTKANTGTVFNIQNTAGTLTVTAINGTAATDAFTVNLASGTTLTNITGGTDIIDVLNINSNGTAANTITGLGTLATNATVNIAGENQLTITTPLPNLGTGKVDASTLAGKLTLSTHATIATTVLGGSAADSITGGTGNDSITGNAGNDTLAGGGGSDTLSGGAGDDTLTGGAAIDRITGDDGADSIVGGGGTDVLSGNAGNDTIRGDAGADSIDGGTDNDSIVGGGGTDTLIGGAGNDTITATTGADAINGGAGADVLTGGITGVNTYTFTLGDSGNTSTTRDQITDLKTTDVIKFGGYGITGLTSGSNLASSASSLTTKEIYVDQVNNRIVIETAVDGSTTEEIAIPSSVGKAAFTYNNNGTASDLTDDYLTVGFAPLTKTNDGLGKLTLVGNTVADLDVTITTNGSPTVGGDAVTGGIVRTLDASAVTGGAVNVTGSTGADSVIGSALADTITGGTGADTITGGIGADTFAITAGDTSTDTITDWGNGTDVLSSAYTGTTAGLRLNITISDSSTTALDLSTVLGAATVLATASVTGGTAADTITGGSSADTITGGSGADVITGGLGVDSLTGGTEADVFVFAAGDSSTTTATAVSDVITDFTTTSDTIKLGTNGSGTNYAEVLTAVADLSTLLTAANTALTSTVVYYFGVIGTNGYLITDDATSAGANNVIQLTGVTDMAFGDIVA
jgi:Ca2+-binding RTX toxin-like protein